jgi:hypothetical protein
MNSNRSRRAFLTTVGQGTLVATLGPSMALDLGLVPRAFAKDLEAPLTFGDLEPLVCAMQETPIEKLQQQMARRLLQGESLKNMIAAAALANARTFGGEDYIGFHTFMALAPALKMSRLMPSGQAALPVFKVLYRNTNRIQEFGGRSAEVLGPNAAADGSSKDSTKIEHWPWRPCCHWFRIIRKFTESFSPIALGTCKTSSGPNTR